MILQSTVGGNKMVLWTLWGCQILILIGQHIVCVSKPSIGPHKILNLILLLSHSGPQWDLDILYKYTHHFLFSCSNFFFIDRGESSGKGYFIPGTTSETSLLDSDGFVSLTTSEAVPFNSFMHRQTFNTRYKARLLRYRYCLKASVP